MKKILIVVDMQEDFISGVFGTPEAKKIVPKVVEKIKERNWDKVFSTHDLHMDYKLENTVEVNTLPEHCSRDTNGFWLNIDVFETLRTIHPDDYYSVTKNTFGAEYLCEQIEMALGNTEHFEIDIVGLCTDICVISNALMLRSSFPYAKITVHEDCCAGTTPEAHGAALMVMRNCCINIACHGVNV